MGQARAQAGAPGGGDRGRSDQQLSAVVKAALEGASGPALAQAALTQYHGALAALDGRSDAQYREGLLEEAQQALQHIRVSTELGSSVKILHELFADCADVVFRGVLAGGRRPAVVVFVDGLIAEERLELGVLEPLLRAPEPVQPPVSLGTWLESVAVAVQQAVPVRTIGQAVESILAGDAVLLMEGVDHGVALSIRGWPERAITEPVSEANIRGPRDGFVETLRTNTMLIRRRLCSPLLKTVRLEVGRRSKTHVDIIYLKGVTSPPLVEEVRRRIARVDVDGILDSGMLEEFIEDQPTSPFPMLLSTERPDRAVAGLLEGQVVVLVDGSPSALLMPATLWRFMTASEDYYNRFWVGTLVLWLRYLFLLLALLGPSLYVAITSFHQEMIPTNLLLSIAAAREGIPFPVLIEALMMEVFFEALREAGIRLPRQVGQAVSIVGALVIGEAAVRAGLASAPVVIIVAATGIASFTIPQYAMGLTVRLLRFPIMLAAGTLGLFGIMVALVAILVHLCALRSFGTPYLQPAAPLTLAGLKSVLVRAPLWWLSVRPSALHPVNERRQGKSLRPGPPGGRNT
ncbi:MAG TPA: spore germination protein [Symbiobacteriaceae bacterium]|nr:spore germination protein [Symbiobacteriaceae bacterium]